MKTLLVIVFLACAAMAASAQNFSGKWSLETQSGRGRSTRILDISQVGNEVTGTITPQTNGWTTGPFDGTIHAGKVDENGTLTFHVWFLRDEPVPQVYVGKLSPDGNEITFTVTTGEGFPPPVVKSLTPRGERNAAWPEPFEVTAKRTE